MKANLKLFEVIFCPATSWIMICFLCSFVGVNIACSIALRILIVLIHLDVMLIKSSQRKFLFRSQLEPHLMQLSMHPFNYTQPQQS